VVQNVNKVNENIKYNCKII